MMCPSVATVTRAMNMLLDTRQIAFGTAYLSE